MPNDNSLLTPGALPANVTAAGTGSGLGYSGDGTADTPAGMRPVGTGLGYGGNDTDDTNHTNDGTASVVADATPANYDVVDVLNDLIENARDGAYGFIACAEDVEGSPQLKTTLSERAAECRRAVDELVPWVKRYGGTPAEGGTATGALHRAWVHTKAAVGVDSAASILDECERGEDASLARYRKALKADLPADVRAVIERQAQGAQRNHDQIKTLRDQARATG